MKTLNVIHQNGLLFNQESGKRLILKEQCEYVITASSDAFEEVDSLNKSFENLKDSKAMMAFVQSSYNNSTIRKLFSSGQQFIFRVGLGKVKKDDEAKVYLFSCRLLEDLYAYRKQGSNFPRLCDCHCVVESCISKNLDHFEPVFGESLNQASANAITHYFSLKRSSAINVFNEFRIVLEPDKIEEFIKINSIILLPNLGAATKQAFDKI